MIKIGNKKYSFDLERIFNYILHSENTNTKEKEITDAYEQVDQELLHTSKVVREITSPGNSQIDNIKYDLIKTLIIQLLTYEENNEDIEKSFNLNFGTSLAFNTLIKEKLLIEIK